MLQCFELNNGGVVMGYEDNPSYRKHKQAITRFLKDEQVDQNRLWMAVGFFIHGAGSNMDKSFATADQWRQLMIATRRIKQPA